jgi:large subunit ribosomal protein L23
MTLIHPLNTEKTIRLLESQNTLVFMVDKRATKQSIKQAVEETFGVKVRSVRTATNLLGQKRAYVALTAEFPAMDVATKLGML